MAMETTTDRPVDHVCVLVTVGACLERRRGDFRLLSISVLDRQPLALHSAHERFGVFRYGAPTESHGRTRSRTISATREYWIWHTFVAMTVRAACCLTCTISSGLSIRCGVRQAWRCRHPLPEVRDQRGGSTRTNSSASMLSLVRISGSSDPSKAANCIAVFACSTALPTD